MNQEYKNRLKTKNKKKPDITVPDLEDEPTLTADEQAEDRAIRKRGRKKKSVLRSNRKSDKEEASAMKAKLKRGGKKQMKSMLSNTSVPDEPQKKMENLYGDWLG